MKKDPLMGIDGRVGFGMYQNDVPFVAKKVPRFQLVSTKDFRDGVHILFDLKYLIGTAFLVRG